MPLKFAGIVWVLTLISNAGRTAARSLPQSVSFQDEIVAEAGGVHNVHITYERPVHGHLSIHYGDCEAISSIDCHHALGNTHVGNHPLARRHDGISDYRPSRFVWLPPDDTPSGGCLHAFSDESAIGRSAPVTVVRRRNRRSINAADIMDAEGPWFNGVEYLKEKEPNEVFVASTKMKTIGILGGGMAGLMTAHLLDSVGFHNWTIVEASQRVGGRVHTSYLNNTRPDEYQYQEMGPMRFPVNIQYAGTNETLEIKDHRMVFQLADVLNNQNKNDSTYKVDFIPWIQSSANDPADTLARRPDGTIPGAAEVMANYSSYAKINAVDPSNVNQTYSDPSKAKEAEEAYYKWTNITNKAEVELFASNVFEAHKKAVQAGYFDWSEAQYLWHVLSNKPNLTDQIDPINDNSPSWLYNDVYYAATEWRTVDQGLSRLPQAFHPQVLNRTVFGRSVQGMSWDGSKVAVKYRNKNDSLTQNPKTMDFDYAMVTVPFSLVRLWELPQYSSLLSRAIATLQYQSSCKVALQYKTRFWEHLEHPIIGGCGAVNISGIGNVCYPSYKINSTGPGVIIGSYASDEIATSLGALPEKEHVALVHRAMIETHGSIAQEQWTGNYDRLCWGNNEYEAGAWAGPTVGQQDLYLPAYFRTEAHTVFIGEHTSYTHAWIFSALESAVRGTTQLLLDMGLVDEAKQITSFWMARWIHM